MLQSSIEMLCTLLYKVQRKTYLIILTEYSVCISGGGGGGGGGKATMLF